MAADKGYLKAMHNYDLLLFKDKRIEMKKKEAARYYKMATDKVHISAMSNYGNYENFFLFNRFLFGSKI